MITAKAPRARAAQPIGAPYRTDRRDCDEALFGVVLHRDDRHTLKFCSELLQQVFDYGEGDACVLTLRIQIARRAVVWTGTFEAAEQICAEADRFQRFAADVNSGSRSPDRDAGQPPMRTTIERVEGEPAAANGRP